MRLLAALSLPLCLALAQDNSDLDNCECVRYFLCDDNRTIKTGGQGILDVRIQKCTDPLDVCCLPPTEGGGARPPPRPDPPPPPPTQAPFDPFSPSTQEPPFDPEKLPGFNPQQPQPQPQPRPQPQPQPPGPVEPYPVVPRPQRPSGLTGCGLKRITTPVAFGDSFRITGQGAGKPEFTGFGEFPWMVAVFRVKDGKSTFVCGGSIIHPMVVLTGAHCVTGNEGGAINIRAGEWDTETTEEPIRHQDRGVSRLIPHPEFDPEALYNDIALVVLDSPLQITDSVDTVCYPGPNDQFDTANCVATGWGKNDFGAEGKYQTILRKVNLPLVNSRECQERLRKTRLGKYFKLHESFICAGGIPDQDTCTGDGGGPLVCPLSTGDRRYTQVGIVAWGIGCGNENPAVYASVQYFSSWIQGHLNQLRLECYEGCSVTGNGGRARTSSRVRESPGQTTPGRPGRGRQSRPEVHQDGIGASGRRWRRTSDGSADTGCGIRGKKIDSINPIMRITGGDNGPEPVGFGEFPWMVAIFKVKDGKNEFVCGGSLITSSVVLTAAHCIGSEWRGLMLRAGDWDLSSGSEPVGHQTRDVVKAVVHPSYDPRNHRSDLALLAADDPFQLGPTVAPVCLPHVEDYKEDVDWHNCFVIGWGKDAFGPEGKYQPVLRGARVSLVDSEDCQESLRGSRLGKYFILDRSFICAGLGSDSCTGDGGGPLVCPLRHHPEGRMVQMGVVSWGIGCGTDYPGVYANVYRNTDWIVNQFKRY